MGGVTKVVSVTTYTKAYVSRGGRQQSENIETHEVTDCSGRFTLDVLRALVVHQTHKLTSYSFEQAVQAVLNEETEELLPQVLAAAPLERAALHAAQRARLVTRMGTPRHAGLEQQSPSCEQPLLTSPHPVPVQRRRSRLWRRPSRWRA